MVGLRHVTKTFDSPVKITLSSAALASADGDGVMYRVEHHTRVGCEVLGHTDEVWAPQTELAKWAALMLPRHAQGESVLIEVATGRAVDRRALWPEAD